MRKRIILALIFTVLLLTACNNSNNSSDNAANYGNNNDVDVDSDDDVDDAEMNQDTEEADRSNNADADEENTNGDTAEDEDGATADSESDRMVIYTADMRISISDFKKAQDEVQSLIDETDGYVVDSSSSSSNDSEQQGQITARIPQETFDDFLDQVEEIADEVKERNVSGEDVTKEYVDLESRLDAKKDVKERLESLMDEADDSDDLLDISNKLGDTQEEIEEIKGEMEYLENHSAMSTVNIDMTEEKVKAGDVKKQADLNTWQKTKRALVASTNAIMTFFSGLVVFLIGFSPILVPLIFIAGIIYWIYRKRKNKE